MTAGLLYGFYYTAHTINIRRIISQHAVNRHSQQGTCTPTEAPGIIQARFPEPLELWEFLLTGFRKRIIKEHYGLSSGKCLYSLTGCRWTIGVPAPLVETQGDGCRSCNIFRVLLSSDAPLYSIQIQIQTIRLQGEWYAEKKLYENRLGLSRYF